MKYPKLSTQETSPARRLLVLALEAPIFLAVIPAALVFGGRALDHALRLPSLRFGWSNAILGSTLGMVGCVFALWSIAEQFSRGRGTPAPQMASQELVTTGPYAYTRNPMALGTILIYIGVALWAGSIMAALLVIILSIVLLTMIKRGEEPALEERFGEAYRRYRRQTPFLIPSLTRRRKEDKAPRS